MKTGISRKHFNEQMDLVRFLMDGYRLKNLDDINSIGTYNRLICIAECVCKLANEISFMNGLNNGK